MRVLLCLIAIGCATPTLPQKFKPPLPEIPADRVHGTQLGPALAELETELGDELSRKKLPSLAVGVVTDDGLVWFHGFGARDLDSGDPITEDTIFRIGSITKVFTGFALLELRDAGKLSLDE